MMNDNNILLMAKVEPRRRVLLHDSCVYCTCYDGTDLPSIVRSWIIYRFVLGRRFPNLLHLLHLLCLHSLIHRLRTPQLDRKMGKRSHSKIEPPSRSRPELFLECIPPNPSLVD